MRRAFATIAALALVGCAGRYGVDAGPAATGRDAPPPPTLFIASDSTASNYPAARYPQTGWGSFIGCALDGTRVDNRAIGGRSTRSFIAEGRWAKLLGDLKAGDTVLIQFGHNDASDNKPERFAAPDTTYRQNLVSFIADVRRANATPVLITPVARRSFAEGRAVADFAAYSAVMRDVAARYGVALVDLESRSRALLDRVGHDAAARLYLHYPAGRYPAFPDGIDDDTHFSELGARWIADLVAEGLAATRAPIAARVKVQRPGLQLAEPLGDRSCG